MEMRQTVSWVQCLHGTGFAPVSVTVPGRLGMAVTYTSSTPCTWATSASQPQPWDSVCVQDTPFSPLLSLIWDWGWKDIVERKWWKKDIGQQINPTYRLLVEGTKIWVECWQKQGRMHQERRKQHPWDVWRMKKLQGQLGTAQEKMSVWGREADVVRDHKKAETKQQVRTKYNKKGHQNKRLIYICKIGEKKSIAYNTNYTA